VGVECRREREVREEKGREMAEIGRLRGKVSWVGGGMGLAALDGEKVLPWPGKRRKGEREREGREGDT
jgi:hypothetical protein